MIEGLPEIVYKYRGWDNEFDRNVILKNQLYLSSPQDFNDPFDCRIPENLHLLTNDDKIEQFALKLYNDHKYDILRKGGNPEEFLQQLINRLKKNLISEQKRYEKITFNMQDKFYAIYSLSTRWDSIIMWSHYSNSHTGYCLGFWEEKLRISGKFDKGGYVKYSEKYPDIDPLNYNLIEKGFITTNTKSKEWEYELEYRLMKIIMPEPKKEDRVITIDDSCYAEIVLGLKFPENQKDLIFKIAHEKNVPVYQVQKVPFEFKIDRIQV